MTQSGDYAKQLNILRQSSGKIKNRRTQIIITPKLDQFMELINKAPASDSTNANQ